MVDFSSTDGMAGYLKKLGDRLSGGHFTGAVSVLGEGQTVNGPVLRVGFLEGATYPDGTSVPMVAAIQEFGAPRAAIPPRPYFRTMVERESPGWSGTFRHLLKGADYDATKAMEQLGQVIKGQLQQSIIDLTTPPLSSTTLMLRKMRRKDPDLVVNRSVVAEARRRVAAGEDYSGVSTKPLIDTGYLLRRVDYEIK